MKTSSSRSYSRFGCVFACSLLISPLLAFNPMETLVSTPGLPMPDIEFDRTNFQVAWEDKGQMLWVADVSPENGIFDIPHRTLLDTGLTPLNGFKSGTGTGNGPEWEFTTGRSQILYTKAIGTKRSDLEVYRATDATGKWSVGPFPDANKLPYGRKGFVPIGNRRENDPDPAFSFYRTTSSGGVALAWRKLNSPVGSIVTELPSGIGRWAAGESNLLAYPGVLKNGGRQVFLFDTNTLTSTQITFSATSKTDPFIFNAPDLDGAQVMAVLESQPGVPTFVGMYRQTPTGWVQFNTLRPPTALKELDSPEPATFNGQSYVFCSALNDKMSPSEIWLMGIRPNNPFYRQVSNPRNELARQDPEYLSTSSGLYIYFTETGRGNVYQCDAGVGPRADNLLAGNGNANQITGTAGNDYIAGRLGADTLTGGAGVDQFAYYEVEDQGDLITDFTPGTDLLDMAYLIFAGHYTGNDPVADGFLQFGQSGPNTQVFLDLDGLAGPGARFLYLTIQNRTVNEVQNRRNFIF